MTDQPSPERSRLVLIVPSFADADTAAARLSAALSGGDVASVIIPQYELDETAFQTLAGKLVPLAQQAGAAAVVAGDTRVAARVQADGVHIEGSVADLADIVRRFGGKIIVGCGGAKTRDDALELGEMQPDYMFFGRFGYDNKPEAHKRNLSLGGWWSQMIEVPCIVLGGSDLASVADVAAAGVEFVALGEAVFGASDPAEAVARANALLDESAAERKEPA